MEYYQYNLNYFMKGLMQINHIFKIIEKINTILLELNSKKLFEKMLFLETFAFKSFFCFRNKDTKEALI